MCGVPRSGSVTLMASREMDSTERVEVEIARDAFLRRELFLGSRRAAANARLNGIVISALDGSPLAFADVGIARGPQTRTNEHGEWTLSDAPLGTHMLDVRAVGYYPAHRAVDVVGEPSTVSVALRTMKAVLDTVKINAREAAETHRAEFEGRRRTGIGRYLTDGEIAGRHPVATSDLFARQTDVDVVKNARSQERFIQMRALGTPCRPAVYIDGQNMNSLTADDIDNAVRPEEIAGIEIYSGAVSPPEFASGSGGVGAERGGRRAQDPRVCGSIVIWTKPAQHVSTGLSWRQRLSIAAGIGAIALVLELLF